MKKMYVDNDRLRHGAITMSLRLLGEHPDTLGPDCSEVMDRWKVELLKMLNGECQNELFEEEPTPATLHHLHNKEIAA